MELFVKENIQVEKCDDVQNKNIMAIYNINLKHVRWDNAGENDDFERACKQEGMGIQIKYTMLNTP